MKTRCNRYISLFLSALLAMSFFGLFAAAQDAPAFAAGDIIEYGTYPQSRVTDENLLAVLPTLPGDWTVYDYEGTATGDTGYTYPAPFTGMQYTDVVYRNVKYRGVRIDAYRPFTVPAGQSEGSTQANNGYAEGGVFWFRWEPLRWRVLDPETGLVMCDTVIDSQPFTQYMDTYASSFYDSEGEYGLKYAYLQDNFVYGVFRSITEWLNGDFLNAAFSPAQQENILQETRVNDYWYVGNGTWSLDGNGYHRYDATATEGKIFLPAWDEVSNEAAGFSADGNAADAARTLCGTDYAKSQGLEVFGDGQTARWLLRTMSRYFNDRCASLVDEEGKGVAHPHTDDRYSRYGICPMMRMAEIVDDSTGNALLHAGDNFYFGAYPQSRVTDADTIALLNERLPYAAQHRRSAYFYNWNYQAEMYVDYADLIVGEHKYRAKIEYMHLLTEPTGNVSVKEYTDYDHHYTDGETEKYVSYYLFEPLLWRVLDPESGLAMCEGIVEQLVYQNVHIRIPDPDYPEETYWYWDAWGNEEQTRYATDYVISNVRPFLNEDFFNTAFTPEQQAKILTTTLDNRSLMTLRGETGYEKYDWDTTEDRVFLLSSADVLNPAYGFSPDDNAEDAARVLYGNDYAGYTDPKGYNNVWLLRNTSYTFYPARRPGACMYNGKVGSTGNWANDLQPICPAIRLSEIDNDTSGATVSCTQHEPTVVPVTPASCTEPGEGREVCALCGAVLNAAVEIPAAGHTPGAPAREDETPATCLAGGSYNEVVRCVRCGELLSSTPGTVPVGAHRPGDWVNEIPATCEAPGVKGYARCTVCRKYLDADGAELTDLTIPQKEHTPGTPARENEVPATCEHGGSYNEVIRCADCGTLLGSTPKTIPQKEHTPGTPARENEVPATCEHGGSYNEVIRCTACGTLLGSTPKTTGALPHQWNAGTVTSAATCTGEGVRTFTCTGCGAKRTEPVAALGHAWGDWVTVQPATCIEEGVQQRVCRRDASHKEERRIGKTGHADANGDGFCDVCSADLHPAQPQSNCVCGQYHTGPFAGIIIFFHRILYFFKNLFGG